MAPPRNLVRQVVDDYAVDPVGENFNHQLGAMHLRDINGHTGTVYQPNPVEPSRSFNGLIAAAPQLFSGLAYLGAGSARPYVKGSPTLESSISDDPGTDAALRILAQRLRRGR